MSKFNEYLEMASDKIDNQADVKKYVWGIVKQKFDEVDNDETEEERIAIDMTDFPEKFFPKVDWRKFLKPFKDDFFKWWDKYIIPEINK